MFFLIFLLLRSYTLYSIVYKYLEVEYTIIIDLIDLSNELSKCEIGFTQYCAI